MSAFPQIDASLSPAERLAAVTAMLPAIKERVRQDAEELAQRKLSFFRAMEQLVTDSSITGASLSVEWKGSTSHMEDWMVSTIQRIQYRIKEYCPEFELSWEADSDCVTLSMTRHSRVSELVRDLQKMRSALMNA